MHQLWQEGDASQQDFNLAAERSCFVKSFVKFTLPLLNPLLNSPSLC